MAASVVTVAFEGVEARRVDVEVQAASGQVNFIIVGLGDKAVGESRERVRAAFAGLGLERFSPVWNRRGFPRAV
jgi:magnesium chelatase family protein